MDYTIRPVRPEDVYEFIMAHLSPRNGVANSFI